MNKKMVIVGVGIVLLILLIFVLDLALLAAGWPTISQAVIYWSALTHLVPALLGALFGGLVVHFWE